MSSAIGFTMKSTAPSRIAVTIVFMSSYAVIRTTSVAGARSRSSWSSSTPLGLRHADVGEHEIRDALGNASERLGSVGRDAHLRCPLRHGVGKGGANRDVVVDNQNAAGFRLGHA